MPPGLEGEGVMVAQLTRMGAQEEGQVWREGGKLSWMLDFGVPIASLAGNTWVEGGIWIH